jgi:hypothetical protein
LQMSIWVEHWPCAGTTRQHQYHYKGVAYSHSGHIYTSSFRCRGSRRAITVRAVIPLRQSRFRRASAPAWICTFARGTTQCSATNLINSSFAAPSTGRAASRILSASPCTPTHSVRDALGWTWTVRIAPCSLSRTITGRVATRHGGFKRSL